ncbi:MAG: hypothetical protein M1835_003184 [Candelina submexicana]|nr:MAG: hypothetical protein M1835_003184 [Candelina submexicana]
MVCAKCQKALKTTELATPGVKRKSEMYYGSPASSSKGAGDKSKTSATLGNNGVGKRLEFRVNCYLKAPRILMPPMPARARRVRQKQTKGKSIV